MLPYRDEDRSRDKLRKIVNKQFKGKTETDTITMGIYEPSESQTISLYYTAVLLKFYETGINIMCT